MKLNVGRNSTIANAINSILRIVIILVALIMPDSLTVANVGEKIKISRNTKSATCL